MYLFSLDKGHIKHRETGELSYMPHFQGGRLIIYDHSGEQRKTCVELDSITTRMHLAPTPLGRGPLNMRRIPSLLSRMEL